MERTRTAQPQTLATLARGITLVSLVSINLACRVGIRNVRYLASNPEVLRHHLAEVGATIARWLRYLATAIDRRIGR